MNIKKRSNTPRYKRDNITSYLLVSDLTTGSKNMTITLVEMEPGGIQKVHSHAPEQTYYILEGSGMMTIDDERSPVQAGDCIFFPFYSKHGLENTGTTVLRYLSAASPSFSIEECKRLWPLPSLEEINQKK